MAWVVERARGTAAACALALGVLGAIGQALGLLGLLERDGTSVTLLSTLAGFAPAALWLVAAWLLRHKPRLGVTVTLTAAVTVLAVHLPLLPSVLGSLRADDHELTTWRLLVDLVPFVVLHLLHLVLAAWAGAAAWRSRPRGGWQADAEVPRWIVAPVLLSALPVVLPATGFRLPAPGVVSPAAWLPALPAGWPGVVTGAVTVVVGTLVLLRLRRGPAGGLLLAATVPQLVALAAQIHGAWRAPDLAVRPAGVVALLATSLLAFLGAQWAREDEAAATPPLPLEA